MVQTEGIVFSKNITEDNHNNVSDTSEVVTEEIVKRLRPFIQSGTCIKFNQSDPFHIGDKYGGIPLNLLTNTIGWSILLVRIHCLLDLKILT